MSLLVIIPKVGVGEDLVDQREDLGDGREDLGDQTEKHGEKTEDIIDQREAPSCPQGLS